MIKKHLVSNLYEIVFNKTSIRLVYHMELLGFLKRPAAVSITRLLSIISLHEITVVDCFPSSKDFHGVCTHRFHRRCWSVHQCSVYFRSLVKVSAGMTAFLHSFFFFFFCYQPLAYVWKSLVNTAPLQPALRLKQGSHKFVFGLVCISFLKSIYFFSSLSSFLCFPDLAGVAWNKWFCFK